MIDPRRIPAELKEMARWVIWRRVVRDGKPTKVPCDADGYDLDATNPAAWVDFDTACERARRWDGIGFAIGGSGFVGVDLDHCLDPETGRIEDWALDLVCRVDSYTEITPSGTGLHIWARGSLPPKGRRKGHIEMYDSGRYFTVTGHHLDATPCAVHERAAELAAIHAELFPPAPERPPLRAVPPPLAMDDRSILDRMLASRNGAKIGALFRGDAAGYPSGSEADLALCSHLAFWFGKDIDAIDRIFRQSGLCDEKWLERDDYRQRTIEKALEGAGTYDPNYRGNGHAPGNGYAHPNGNGAVHDREPGGEDEDAPNRTDLGNARRLVTRHGTDLHYCHPWGKWLIWRGDRWQADETASIFRRARDVVRAIHAEVAQEPDEAVRKALAAWAIASESEKRINSMVSLARQEPAVPVLPDQFDADPWLLNCPNGTLDLRTGAFRPHERADLLTKRTGIPYDPDATCPTWDAFLDRIMEGNRDMIAFLSRAVGYSLTGDVSEHALFFLYGRGRNGKALALDTAIPTPMGWSAMGTIKAGDTIFSEDGKPCTVLETTEVMHGHSCYEVVFKDGSRIVADAGHLWETDFRRNPHAGRVRCVMTTQQIRETLICTVRKNGRIEFSHRIPVAGPLRIPIADLPLAPYTLGAWLGDGHSDSARLTCADIDAQIVEEIRSEGLMVRRTGGNGKVSLYTFGDGRGKGTQSSPQSALRDLGVLGKKHIPAAYHRASAEQRIALLQGIMDTDGTISANGQCEVTLTNRRLSRDLHELLCGLGFKPTFRTERATIGGRDCGEKYRVQFWAYRDCPVFRLERKRARQKASPLRSTFARYRQIVAVNPVASVPVRCIRVDSPSGLFLAGTAMIPTHNSTFIGAIQHILGDYAITINADLLTARSGEEHPTGVADLQGRRFVATIEVEDGRRMAEALVKTLTGGDRIRARRMRQDFYEFPPTHKIFLAANHKPTVNGTDDGIWRRIKLIPFAVQIPPEEVDRDLPGRLQAEGPGILAWAVRGLREWRELGLAEPTAVTEATAGYREEMDTLAAFLAERCVLSRDCRARPQDLYRDYAQWCEGSGTKPVAMRRFGLQLSERGIELKKSNSVAWRVGIGLRADYE